MSVTSRHSPAIPLSPPSPPDTGVKERSKTIPSANAPQSPASPPLMSVATKSYASSFPQPPSDAATSQQSFSPPSTTADSTKEHRPSMMADSMSFPTPASSVNGLSRAPTVEDQDQHRSKRQKMESDATGVEDKMDTDQQSGPSSSGLQNPIVETQQSQGTLNSDGTGVDLATNPTSQESRLASDDVSLEQLQKDMSDAFLLCRSSKTLIPSLCYTSFL